VNRVGSLFETFVYDLRVAVFHIVVNVFIGSSIVPSPLRRVLYRALGFKIGGASLSPHLMFKSNNVDIGDHVFINEGCSFDNLECVTIGDHVHVGPQVMFGTSSHQPGNSFVRAGAVSLAPLVVCSGSWIGARAVLLPGVKVGEGCVVGAGAVVTRDCQPHGLYAGVPARRIRDLPQ
jgi:acetyltransferase-like isoleucine patch superfamily enzyme